MTNALMTVLLSPSPMTGSFKLSQSLLIFLAEAEAKVEAANGGLAADAIGATQAHGLDVPTAAAQHAVGAAFRASGILIRG